MSKKNKNILRKATTVMLSMLMSFSSFAVNTFAEETPQPTETPVVEVQENQETETDKTTVDLENPTVTVEPEETETPQETAVPSDEEKTDNEKTDITDGAEKTEEKETPSSVTTKEENQETPDKKSEDQKEEVKEKSEETIKEEKNQEVEEEKPEEPEFAENTGLKVYKASDIVDYISAIAVLSDNTDVKLTVNSFNDITTVIDYGVGVYFDGMYTLEFKDVETRNKAYSELAVALGGNAILKDDAMAIDWVGEMEVDETPKPPVDESEEQKSDENKVEESAENTAPEKAEVTPEPTPEEVPEETPEADKAQETQDTELEEINPDANVASEVANIIGVAESGNQNTSRKTVALIDSGVNGYADATVNLTNDGDADAVGHGTRMAQIIKEIAGESASILSIKAFNDDGSGSIANVTAAVKLATEMNVDYINISASILDSKNTVAFKEAVNEALAKGIVVVASAGNNGTNAGYFAPANIPGVDTVGAAEPWDNLSAFKVTLTSNYGDVVDWYYIADSTSEAAAMETGVLVGGLEEESYSNTGRWFRFNKVFTDKTDPEYYDPKNIDHVVPIEEFINSGEVVVARAQELYEQMQAGFILNASWHCSDASPAGSKVCTERYYNSDGTLNPQISTFYYFPPGTYYDGSKEGVQMFCQEPDVYSMVETTFYTCSWTDGGTSYTGSKYDGVQVQHYISFDGQKVDAYDPATHNSEETAYTWTDTNGTLAEGNYRNSISVGEGDASKVHYSVSGNTLKVWFDADPDADMPDDITITIDGGKYKAATKHHCEGGFPGGSVYCSAIGQDLAGGGNGSPATCYPGEDGYTYNPAKVNLKIIRGEIVLQKVDAERDYAKAQGDATLAGAEVTVINPSGRTYTGKTDESGALTISKIKWGDWTATETGASLGYLLNEDWSIDFQIREPNQHLDFSDSEHQIKEQVIRGDVRVYKQDLEMSKVNGANPSQAIGGKAHRASTSSLNGITFEVKNVSKLSILSDANELLEYEPGELVVELLTEWDEEVGSYVAQTKNKAFPYGTFSIQETKTNNAYLLTDGTIHYFEIREDGAVVDVNKNGATMIVKNQIKRGEFGFVKTTSSNEPMQTLWVLENSTSGEKHVIVTDVNGEYISSDVPHSQNTNANDFLLEQIEKNGYDSKIDLMKLIADGSITELHGLWFGMGEEGDVANVDDSLMSMPWGPYVLHEVRTDTNVGKDLQERSFNIARNNHQLATFTIRDEGITLKTTATEKETGLHSTMPNKNTVLVDKVEIKDISEYGDYTLKTYLVYSDSSEPVLDAQGNPVETEQVVTLNKLRQTVNVEVTFDSTNLGGRSVVFFEELYNSDGELVAEHKNPLDPDQTIVFPGIRTTLKDDLGGKPASTVEMVHLTDTVKYEGLTVGKTYTMIGELHQRSEEGEDLGVLEGVEPVSVEFKARTSDGEVKVEFDVPSNLLKNKIVVAFEECYDGEILVAVHADITDEEQTIVFEDPEIKTTAVDKADGDHRVAGTEEETIVDTVEYKNLTPGIEYEMRGTLHMRDMDGNDVGTYKDENDNELVVTKKFTPESKNGTVDLEFTVDVTLFEEDASVVFEQLFLNGELIAKHEEISDENQTIYIDIPDDDKWLRTVAVDAKDGDKLINAEENASIKDTVEYIWLKRNKEYTLKGEIHINRNGNDAGVLMVNGQAVKSELVFTPTRRNGEVEMLFNFDASSLRKDDKLVVFEEVYDADGNLVAEHKDINDEGQTVIVDGPAIEKYVNKDVHQVLGSFTERFTYDIMAYVTSTAEEVVIKDDLVDLLVFADENVTVTYHDENDHKVKGTVATKGSDVEANVNISGKHLEVTIPDAKPYRGKWVKVTFNARIRDGINTLSQLTSAGGQWLTIEDDGTVLGGKTPHAGVKNDARYSIFVDNEGEKVERYKDIPSNTVTVTPPMPEIRTNAKDGKDGDKNVITQGTAKVIDTVSYKNLEPGKTYRLKGRLMDKSTGQVLVVGGKEVTATLDFKPTSANGSVELSFTFNATGLKVGKYVVFEKLYIVDGSVETLVATHEDINDAAQTITAYKPGNPPTQTPPSVTRRLLRFVKTGTGQGVLIVGGIALFAVLAFIFINRKKKEDNKAEDNGAKDQE